ncbi:hypothetical protein RDI58_015313 [Solanum bulbocastanum]|uniref:Uncharacterized protein n=1 Tax=Solanum bulbocastanum TaxID=147425 RepID=A0AAN8TLC7_SOLBU
MELNAQAIAEAETAIAESEAIIAEAERAITMAEEALRFAETETLLNPPTCRYGRPPAVSSEKPLTFVPVIS